MAAQAESATIFGAQLSDTFLGSPDSLNVRIVTSVLIVLMCATTFLTQRQLMTKNMPASALDNPFAKQQKLLLYVLPVVFAVSGVNFPIGVLIYWFTTNLWSMCQQFYVIRRMPAPGSAAEKSYHARLAKKGKPIPGAAAAAAAAAATEAAEAEKASGQRVQPTSKKKRKKSKTGGAKAPGKSPGAAPKPPHDLIPLTAGDPHERQPHPGRAGRDDRRHRDRAAGRDQRPRHHAHGRRHHDPTDDDTSATTEDDATDATAAATGSGPTRRQLLEREGEVAADFLETLLDICDLDGDIDVDIDGDRAAVSVVDSEDGRVPRRLVGQNGQVLDALQELTRLAVQSATGERSRLMLDVASHRAERRAAARHPRQGGHRGGAQHRGAQAALPDERLRAQGRPRRGARRRARLGVRGRRAAPVRRHPPRVRRRFT